MTSHEIIPGNEPAPDRSGLSTDRLRSLLECYEASGSDIATIYLPSFSRAADAERQLEIRAKNVHSELEAAKASEAMINHVAEVVADHSHDDGAALLVVVTEDRVLYDVVLDRPVDKTTVAVGPTPMLLPMMAVAQVDEPHLAVLLDRTGADVYQRDGVGAPIDSMEVDGDDVRVHRGHPGGWSQKRFQQTAENAWENNAKDAVEALLDEYGRDHPVIVAGDERAVGFFTEHLPESIDAVIVDGSRHADHDAFLDEADEAMRTRAAARVVADLDRFRSRLGADTGAAGRTVLDQLSRGQVEHLLVVDDSLDADRATARFDFSVPMHRLDDDHGPSSIAPVTDGAVALAAATGASITVIPASVHGIEDGLGAVLRF